ncbi:hypothetical protein MEQU1_003424 [Malassezia equina]|uniref:Uncharacterized protein n=1 Tax=Malassezia equina TaxID=1381935 RepID=A0AAF0EL48_9BASI|nr:hypothetical protein MEQU1_003424 [Malassezia equina]
MPSAPINDYTSMRHMAAQDSQADAGSSTRPSDEPVAPTRPAHASPPLQRRFSQLARNLPHMRSVSSLGYASHRSGPSSSTEPRAPTAGNAMPRTWRAGSMPMQPHREDEDDLFDADLLEVHRSMTSSPVPLNDTFLIPSYGPLSDKSPATSSSPSLRRTSSSLGEPSRVAENVVLILEPATRALHMFGPLHVTGSYSLSGTIKLSLPHATSTCDNMDILALCVVFTGYSMYVDGSGRYSCVRLCEVTKELVTTPMCVDLPPNGPPMLDSLFDVGAPGWLPASISTRTVSTFYSLQATAVLRENDPIGLSPLLDVSSGASPSWHAPISVSSAPMLVVVHRTRDLVSIPLAQRAEFTGVDVPLPANPFCKTETNPFRRGLKVPAPGPAVTPPPRTPDVPPASGSRAPTPPQRGVSERTCTPVALRHYSHVPKLHLPTPSFVQGTRHEFLPLKVTLSVPSHLATHTSTRGEQAPLVFGLHIALDPIWQHVRYWSDLRLCELEAACVQMEKYSSHLSRSYCMAFALPTDGSANVSAAQLPVFDRVPRHLGMATPQSAAVQMGLPGAHPFHRPLVENRVRLDSHGAAPTDRQNGVERFRAYTVGPLPDRERERQGGMPPAASKDKSVSKDEKSGVTVPWRRRTVSNALHRLSMLGGTRDAPAPMPPGAAAPDLAPSQTGPLGEVAAAAGSAGAAPAWSEGTKASYVFDGEDGHGLALLHKRVRLSFSLPLVPSSSRASTMQHTPQLLPDYESPHMRVRHKLKVKMRFGFGASPLAPNVGVQSVVMSVPIRFSEAPPSEALAQAPPLVLPAGAEPYVPSGDALGEALPSAYAQASHSWPATRADQAYLPAYTQLFRADGSRLSDDEEVLPPYPDQQHVSMEPAYPSLSALLASQLYLVSDETRENKSAASVSMLDALNAHDDELFNVAAHVDDDMMEERLATEGAFDDDMELGRGASSAARTASPLLDLHTDDMRRGLPATSPLTPSSVAAEGAVASPDMGHEALAPALSYLSPSLGAVARPA